MILSLLVSAALGARPQVVVVMSDDLEPYTAPVQAFTDSVGVPVQTVQIHGRELEAEIEVLALKAADPKVVFALGAKAAYAVRTMMPSTPMIYGSVLDPVRYGLPGRQVTGVGAVVPPVTYLSQVTTFFPEVQSIGILRDATFSEEEEAAMKRAAKDVGVTIYLERVDSPRTFRRVFNRMAEAYDAVWVTPERGVLTPEGFRTVVEEMRRRRKPLLADTANMVAAGAAFAVTPDPDGVGRQAAALAERILDGAAPAIMPAEDPQQLSTALNMRVIRGARIPHEPLMVDFADVLIE